MVTEDGEADEHSNTQVDLGSDLLEQQKKGPIGRRKDVQSFQSRQTELNEMFSNAVILMNEGIEDEAKKTLRAILREDPNHVNARKKLEEILDEELKRTLKTEFAGTKRIRKSSIFRGSVEDVVNELDRDLNLGITEDRNKIKSLEEAMSPQIVEKIKGLNEEDRLDLGIAFLEMDLYHTAEELFDSVHRSLDFKDQGKTEINMSAIALYSYCKIMLGAPLDAVLALQSAVGDLDNNEKARVEFKYLLGRAFEALKKTDMSRYWYNSVMEEDPSYRDVWQRIGNLQ